MREPPPRFNGFSLSGILSELALMCLYGGLVSRVTIVTLCESVLVAVHAGGMQGERLRDSVWTSQSPVVLGTHR